VSSERYRFGPFELDVTAHRLSRDGQPLLVQPKPMELLVMLAREPDRLHGRKAIVEALWPDTMVTEQSLRQVVYKLREVLGDHASAVETVPRVGVRMTVPVIPLEGGAVLGEVPAPAPAAPAPPAGLPPERGAFVGRSAELDELDAASSQLVTLVGPGGVGKTRLGLRYARARAGRLPGGVWFCDLAPARSRDDVVSALASALGVLLSGDVPARVGHALAFRGACLVLLDNFEQVQQEAAGLLDAWRERAPEARFLVTSRVALGLVGEQVLPLSPLPEVDAIALFQSRCRGVGPEHHERLGELVRMLDCLPLCIELAASRAAQLTPPQLIQGLSDRFRVLQGAGSGRQSALRATLDWSWELLSPTEREVLAQLSVFVGGFRLEAAEAVVEVPDGIWAADVIESLCDRSLVQRGEGERLSMLISVREYAWLRLHEQGERARPGPLDRHGLYFASFGGESALAALNQRGGTARRTAWLADLDNLVAACRRALQSGWASVAAGTALAVADLVRRVGPQGLALELLQGASALAGPVELGRVQIALGIVLLELGQAAAAEAQLEQARDRAHQAGLVALEAGALQALAQFEHDRGRPDRSRARVDAALALLVPGDPATELLQARLRATAGAAAMYLGRLAEGRAELEQAIVSFRVMGAQLFEARACLNLAVLLGQMGELELSGARYREALQRMREAGDRFGLGVTLSSLAAWCDKTGRLEEAQWYLQSSLTLARELGDRRAEGIALTGLGRHSLTPDPRPYLEASLAIHREHAWDYGMTFPLCGLARLAQQEGRSSEALALVDEAVQRAGTFPSVLTMALVERAALRLAAGQREAAGEDLAQARALGLGGLEGAQRAVVEARLALARRDLPLAEQALAEASRDPSLLSPTSEVGRAVTELREQLEALRD
jgi:predicted ATPase/DNA-binding winged helix-turn-helix (wHTH) protein